MMQIRTGQVKHLPYERHEVTQGHEEHEMRLKSNDADTYTNACLHQSLHSTGLRLAVVIHKLSNVKLDTSVASGSDDEALQCNVRRSLDAARSSESASFSVLRKGATPGMGYGCLFNTPH
jgi:hypothetical protein